MSSSEMTRIDLVGRFRDFIRALSDAQAEALTANWENVMGDAALDRIDSWVIAGRALEELHKDPEPARPEEGWGIIRPGDRKAHYYRKGMALCRRVGFYSGPLDTDDKPSSDDHKECRRLRDKELAEDNQEGSSS